MKSMKLASTVVLFLSGGVPAIADGFPRPGIPLEEFLLRPLTIYQQDRFPLTAADMHLLGRVRESQKRSIFRLDDGKIIGTMVTTTFFEDGRIKEQKGQDVVDPAYGFLWRYVYDAAKLLIRIDRYVNITHETSYVILTYDPSGHLTGLRDENPQASSAEVVDIENQFDGRPKEVITRDGLGKATWRVEYDYGDRAVTIHYFDAGLLGASEVRSAFKMDDKGAVLSADVVEHDESGIGSGNGTFRSSYHSDGSKSLEVEQASEKSPRAKCRLHMEYLPNGYLDDGTKLQTDCPSSGAGFNVEGPRPSKHEQQFDQHGNLTMERSGWQKSELGRTVTRWTDELSYQLSYY